MEQRDFVNRIAGLLGFNRVYNRANNAHVVATIEEQLTWGLDYITASKTFLNNKAVQTLTLASKTPIMLNSGATQYEAYAYWLPYDFVGYVSDNGVNRDIIEDKLYSDIKPDKELTLVYKKRLELQDIPLAMFQYVCLEIAIMVAPSLGEDKKIAMLEAKKNEYLNGGMSAMRVSRNNDIFAGSRFRR